MNTNQFTQKTMEALQAAQRLAIEYSNQALEPGAHAGGSDPAAGRPDPPAADQDER